VPGVERRTDILAVDDDRTVRTFLTQALAPLPATIHLASTCREFREMAERLDPSLYLIDVELPDGDGFELADGVRAEAEGPVIFFSAYPQEDYRLRALELGAVDYLAKPIHPRELTLRVRNLLGELARHRGERGRPAAALRRFGTFTLDVRQRRLLGAGGEDLGLTGSEYEVLACLTAQPYRVVTREEITEQLGPQSAARHNPRIVDILIWRLRRKLQDNGGSGQLIVTVPSRGYTFAEDVSSG
jgi:DNA-binding response OmpR family regulator